MLNHKIARLASVCLAASVFVPLVSAQATDSDPDGDYEATLQDGSFGLSPRLLQMAFRQSHPWTISTSVRYNSNGISVGFGDLGTVPSAQLIAPPEAGPGLRVYDDGAVAKDDPRPFGDTRAETLEDGTVFSEPFGRYSVTDNNGLTLGDYLAYTPDRTRTWAYDYPSQISSQGVGLSTYSSLSTGGEAYASSDGGAVGFEMQVSRRAMRLSEKSELNLTMSIGLNDVQAGTAGSVTSDLQKLTDIYQIYGSAPGAPFRGPSFTDLLDDNGNIILTDGRETTAPISDVAIDQLSSVVPGGATVHGRWEIDGGYYSIRMGPQLRSQLSERLGLTIGAGVAAAYVGTNFKVSESIDTAAFGLQNSVSVTEQASHNEVILGYYAEFAAELWLTVRTSLFIGGAYESIGDYTQTFRGRTATVDLGNNFIARVGITTRF